MKTFKGKTCAMRATLLARVEKCTYSESVWPLANTDFGEPCGYILRKIEDCMSGIPQFVLSDDCPDVIPDDIVLLEPDGKGTVLYEVGLDSNSLVITNRCNLSCVMCPQPQEKNITEDLNIAEKILTLIRNEPKYIGITGGEPTLAWHELIALLSSIRSKFPSTSIQLLTNGIALQDFNRAKELYDCCGDSLLVCIPLYSDVDRHHDEIVNKTGAFWATVEGLNNLARLGVYTELRTVIMKMNAPRLSKWAAFVSRFLPFVGHIALMGIEPLGRAKIRIHELLPQKAEMVAQLEGCIKHFNRVGIRAYIYNIPLCDLPIRLHSYGCKSISEWKRQFSLQCTSCSLISKCGGFFRSWTDIPGFSVNPVIPSCSTEKEGILI